MLRRSSCDLRKWSSFPWESTSLCKGLQMPGPLETSLLSSMAHRHLAPFCRRGLMTFILALWATPSITANFISCNDASFLSPVWGLMEENGDGLGGWDVDNSFGTRPFENTPCHWLVLCIVIVPINYYCCFDCSYLLLVERAVNQIPCSHAVVVRQQDLSDTVCFKG